MKAILAIFALMLLTGCSVDSVSFKLTDLEYERTDNGFKLKTDNWTDILINQPQLLPGEAPPPGMTYSNNTTGIPGNITLNNVTNVTNETREIVAEVENNTIKLAYG